MLVAYRVNTENKIQPKGNAVSLFLPLLSVSTFVLTCATISTSVRSIIYRPHFFSDIIKTGGLKNED